MSTQYLDPNSRYCDSCSDYWRAETPMEFEEGRPVWEYCPDCIASLCVDCGLSACQDIHDGKGAGKHEFNDGECRALVPIRYCIECKRPTTGSIGAAGLFWKFLCQGCKDYHDGYLRAQVQTQAVLMKAVDKVIAA